MLNISPPIKLTKEKAELEKRLEAEEEYIVNKLQGKLDEVLKEKAYGSSVSKFA